MNSTILEKGTLILTYYIRISEEDQHILEDHLSNCNIEAYYIHESFLPNRNKGSLLYCINMSEEDATALKLVVPTIGWVNFGLSNQTNNATM
jgi:hypothetical protein